MNSKFLPLALTAVLAFGAATAQAEPAVQSGTYVIEPNHTEVLFAVSHFGFTTYYGQFPGASGQLVLDAAHPSDSRLEVSVPVAGIMTGSPQLAEELKGADWFNAASFPTMTFRSTRITPTGPDSADVAGDLTLHGVTRPVMLKATLNRAAVNPMDQRYTAGFKVSGVVKRSEFGVSKYVPMVGDDVDLIISAAFERKAP